MRDSDNNRRSYIVFCMKNQYAYQLSNNWGFAFPILAVLVGVAVNMLALPFNVDTLYDEGYLYLSVEDARHGMIDGLSQWAPLVITLLGNEVCSSILLLRIVRLVLALLTGILFVLVTHTIAENKREKIQYAILSFLLLVPSMGGLIISYNGLAQFFQILACASLYRLLTDEKVGLNVIWAIMTGFLITASIFIILPSAVLLGVCTILLVCVRYWREWKSMLMYLAGGLSGILLALLFIHCFVADLTGIIHAMQTTAQTVTTLDRGYDPFTFVTKILLFLRDWLLCICVLIGIVVISVKLQSYSKILAFVFYAVTILLYLKYQQKPMVTLPMAMIVLWIISCRKQVDRITKQIILNDKALFESFLLFFPLIASIGTNVYLGGKMTFFIMPWALGLWMMGFNKDVELKKESLLVLSIVLLMGSWNQFKSIDYSYSRVQEGALKGMYLNPMQEEHFATVDSIVKTYGFKKGESVVFFTQLSSMTECYLGGAKCGNYFQPMDFVAHAQDSLPAPDFLFLCKYDEDIAGETLQQMDWGWPEEFDKYYVGSPDALYVGYPTERWLYCRKIVK